MAILGLPEKEIKKTAQDLIDLHCRVILHWLIEKDVEYTTRKKFWAIYDHYVNRKNINYYFHLPIKVFVISLIKDDLDRFSSKKTKKRKKRRK